MSAPRFTVEMKHSEDSLVALSHMQYDQFCHRNLIVRSIIAVGCILLGISYSGSWWAILIIAYGCYLLSSKYVSANRTAHKLANGIRESKLPFPASRFEFYAEKFIINDLNAASEAEPSVVSYGSLIRLGEDYRYYYLFPTQFGGYMVSKDSLGDSSKEFKLFLQEKTGMKFSRKTTPIARMMDSINTKNNEPYHL